MHSYTVAKLIQKVASSGQISRKDYMHLTSMILSMTTMTPFDRRRINQVLDAVQTQQITLLD